MKIKYSIVKKCRYSVGDMIPAKHLSKNVQIFLKTEQIWDYCPGFLHDHKVREIAFICGKYAYILDNLSIVDADAVNKSLKHENQIFDKTNNSS